MLRAPEDFLVEHTTLVGFSILVLEPIPGAAQAIRRTLEGAGAKVLPTSSRKQALLVIEKGELSPAVLDYNESATQSRQTETAGRANIISCASNGYRLGQQQWSKEKTLSSSRGCLPQH